MEPTIFSQIKAMFRSLSGVLKKQNAEVDRRFVDYDEAMSGKLAEKLDAHNPVATGSFSLGRRLATTVGKGSLAVGNGVEASGNYSFSQGLNSIASGAESAAIGSSMATGRNSFAQGGATASGDNSAAFGSGSRASALNAFATGGASAGDSYSFAVGSGARANGDNSRALGCQSLASGPYSCAYGFCTLAYGKSTHVFGEYNSMTGVSHPHERGTYVLLVGNGTADNKRHNAHTLDWDGTGWFAGGLKIGGTGQDDPDAVDVLTTADVSPVATSGSWNDLGDKPFGAASSERELVFEKTQSIPSGEMGSTKKWSVPVAGFVPQVGKLYTIEATETTSGTKLRTTAIAETEATNFFTSYKIGEETEPIYCSGSIAGLYVYINGTAYTGWRVEIYEVVETLTTLDEKYLPDTIARVKDIPTVSDIIAELPIYNGEVEEV